MWSNAILTPLERPAVFAGKEFLTEEEAAEVEKEWAQYSMPSFRATLNMSFFKHLSLFGSFNLDGNFIGQNDKAFTYGSWNTNPYVLKKNTVQLYPSFSIGLKF